LKVFEGLQGCGEREAEMTSVDQVLKIAKGELGTKESPADSNVCKYSRWYPMVGPWCAMFVSWVLDKADIEGYKHAFTPAGAELFKSQGRWTQNPRPGDVAYFDFPDSLPRIQHVGFVEKVSGSVLTTIEGNTSSGAAGSQDNGGGVFRRERARSLIVGFGRPPYGKGGDVGDSEKEFKKKNWFSLDDTGADVKLWQRQLNTVMEADLEVSGKFDKQTLEVTKIFQKANALEDDGRVGSKTIRKMEGAYQEIKGGKGDKPPTLELWDEGAWVKRAQERLMEHGFKLKPDGADGEFGPITGEAVVDFKKRHDLPARPVIGPRAWKALLAKPGGHDSG
jgi:peptidoglycan hydrolase-like protein with peptidoglycan-binding domain